jgi:integrase
MTDSSNSLLPTEANMTTDSRSDGRKPLPPGIKGVSRNGREYLYAKTPAGLIPLKGEHRESGTLLQPLAAALRLALKSPPPRIDRFASLIRDFLASPEHRKKTAPATQKLREHALDLIEQRFGRFAIRDFSRREIRRDIYSFRNDLAATPRMADVCIETLSRVLNWAYDQGAEIEMNHALRIERLSPARRTRAEIVWSDEERATFIEKAELAVATAFQALFYSAARVGDAGAWRWENYDGKWPVFAPAKTSRSTGIEVHLPAYAMPPFHQLLEDLKAETKGEFILTTETGRPWVRTYLTERFIDERKRVFGANFDRHLHDLRGTTSTKLIDAGCTDREVSAITGHVTAEATADRARSLSSYVKRTRQQAINAYTKWYNAEFAARGEVIELPRRA